MIAGGYFLNLPQLLTYYTNKQRDAIELFIRNRFMQAVGIYMVIYMITASLSIPGAAFLTVLGGFLFGLIPAACAAIVSATIGATIAFLLVRFGIGSWLHKRYKSPLRTFNEEFERSGIYYLVFLRFMPFFPFFLTNILIGLTNISITTFVITTLLGIIPGTLVYANAGSQLSTIDKWQDIASPSVIISFVLLALFSLVPLIIKKFINYRSSQR